MLSTFEKKIRTKYSFGAAEELSFLLVFPFWPIFQFVSTKTLSLGLPAHVHQGLKKVVDWYFLAPPYVQLHGAYSMKLQPSAEKGSGRKSPYARKRRVQQNND